MIVYHGSNSNFKNFKISKSLVKHQSTMENEGLGIYFSTDKKVAESYGKYLYTLSIDDRIVYNFNDYKTCQQYINNIARYIFDKTKVNIGYLVDLSAIATNIQLGGVSIANIDKELLLWFDSREAWHTQMTERSRNAVKKALREVLKINSAKVYLFNYHIKGCGVAKSADLVKIVNKECNGIRVGGV